MRFPGLSHLVWLLLTTASLPVENASADFQPSPWQASVGRVEEPESSASFVSTVAGDQEVSYPPMPAEANDFIPPDQCRGDSSPDPYPIWGLTYADVLPYFQRDDSLRGLAPISDPEPTWGYSLFVDYDAFRGVSDGGWGNYGLHTGANLGTRLGQFSDWTGIGFQAGASVGVFDWAGTDYRIAKNNAAETQGFITYGLYRKPDENSRWNAAIVHDWMLNNNFGVFAASPLLSQLRMQLGYAMSASNELGIWGAVRTGTDSRIVPHFGSTTWRSVNQISAYWRHKWSNGGPDTTISVGLPEQTRLAGGGSLGDYLITLAANAPLSDAVSLYANVTYMHQSASLGAIGSNDEAWNFSIGIAVYPRRNARFTTIAGQRWMPQMPVANNGSFLVDTSQKF